MCNRLHVIIQGKENPEYDCAAAEKLGLSVLDNVKELASKLTYFLYNIKREKISS